MAVRPLTGQVMVWIIPDARETSTGLALPDKMPVSAETVQFGHRKPSKPPAVLGRIEAVGPWPIKKGKYHLPEFKVGQQVAIGHLAGQQLSRGVGERLRMVRYDQVLAVLDDEPDAV